jgi:hypothetical protein
MCSMRACSVCECEEGEVPKPWLALERGLKSAAKEAGCAGDAKPDCSTADCECPFVLGFWGGGGGRGRQGGDEGGSVSGLRSRRPV